MSNNGYQKFFKDARQAKGESNSVKTSDAARAMMSKNIRQSKLGPEQALKAALAERMQQKKAQKKAKKAKFPVGSAVILALLVAGSALGSLYQEQIEQYASKIEIGFLGSAQAASDKTEKTTAKVAATKVETPAKTAEPTEVAKKEEVPDTRNWTPEELSFFNKLNERKQELDHKESELAKLEEELQQQKAELELKIQQLEKMRSEISGVLKDKVATDQVKVDKLVQVYAGMKPQQAARVIETINEDLAVEVLDKMKKKSASEILNMMDAKKAQKLSEALAGYRTLANE